jgi:hypothetical protein
MTEPTDLDLRGCRPQYLLRLIGCAAYFGALILTAAWGPWLLDVLLGAPGKP